MKQDVQTPVHFPQVVQFQPAFALRPYVDCYWMLDAPYGFDAFAQRMPADSRTELIFSFGAGMRRTAADDSDVCDVGAQRYVLGTRRQGYLFQPAGAVHYVAIRFKPGGMSAFSRVPLVDLGDIYVDADCLWDRAEMDSLQECLATLSPEAQALRLDKTLLTLLNPQVHIDRILYCLDRIGGASYAVEIAPLADDINLSQKQMERLFFRYVGFSPSFYTRIARFQRALTGVAMLVQPSLSQIALEAGYYDQAHFSREFKEFAGVSPARFFGEMNPYVETFNSP